MDNLPVEITEAFTDMGHPLYEWVVNGHGWEPAYYWYLGPYVQAE